MPRRGERKVRRLPGDPLDRYGFAGMGREYLEWMAVKNYSPRTIENRHLYLGYFIAWCHERGVDRPQEVTKPILERYARWLYHLRREDGRPLSFRAQHSRLVAVRAFFKWAARQNFLLFNAASELELPKLEQRLPKAVLTASEADQILNQPDVGDVLGLRDRAILEVLYSTGIRRAEIIGLGRYDLDVDRGTVMVRQGKGRKDRMIPIGDRALAWVDRYLLEVRPELVVEPEDGALFLTHEGTTFAPSRMTQLVRGYVMAADVGKSGACHLFRHTMATLMLEGGADIRFIQQMLGHAKLETTQIYTQVSIRQLKSIHSATHPGAGLGRSPVALDDPEPTAEDLLQRIHEEGDDLDDG